MGRTLYYDAKGYKPDLAQSAARDGGTGLGEYEQSLLQVGIIDTVSQPLSCMPRSCGSHIYYLPH